jgi:hypothetical protein
MAVYVRIIATSTASGGDRGLRVLSSRAAGQCPTEGKRAAFPSGLHYIKASYSWEKTPPTSSDDGGGGLPLGERAGHTRGWTTTAPPGHTVRPSPPPSSPSWAAPPSPPAAQQTVY